MTPAELAPAKINLALHVTGRRGDGYHLVESLVTFTRFGDRIHLDTAENDSFEITGPYAATLQADQRNLVLRARDALRNAFSEAICTPVAIRLEKNLPVASGVGGGSSDAAATLRGLAALWQLDAGQAASLPALGMALGADVPMCLQARPLIARGVGEMLSPLKGFPGFSFVLTNPGPRVTTPEVFSALDRRNNATLPAIPSDFSYDAFLDWLRTTRNDLEDAAESIEPSIKTAKASLRDAGADFVRMSGSGATCFGIFRTGNLAKRAAILIRKNQPGWFVASTRSMPSEDLDEQN